MKNMKMKAPTRMPEAIRTGIFHLSGGRIFFSIALVFVLFFQISAKPDSRLVTDVTSSTKNVDGFDLFITIINKSFMLLSY
jgi:hypothetical protein